MTEAKAPKYHDGPTQWLIYPAMCFMIVGMTVGLFISFNAFIFPDYFSGEYIHFGKLRPVHVMGILFLWLLSANLGLCYFLVQRLCGTRIWSVKLAYVSIALWWLALIPSQFSYPFGTNYGWEYDETPMFVGWLPVKPMLVVAWVMTLFNFYATTYYRKNEKLYVSMWYVLAAMVWATVIIWVGGFTLEFLPRGISRVNAQFFYVHNLVGLIFTPLGLAIAYYYLPKLANTPIYSHKLSMIGFWSLAFIYGWVGAHHIIHGPITQWIQTVSIIFSVWLFIPVFTVVLNIFATLHPNWKQYTESAPVRFIVMGNIFYLITSVQGSFMAVRNINEITSKTDWVIGHSHIALYGTFTFFAIAGIYYVVPVITKKPLWSKRLADWSFALNVFGSVPFILSLWIGGYLQGLMWASWATGTSYADFKSNLSHLPFLETLALTYPWWLLRSIGGIIVLVANILFVVNIFNTVMLKPREDAAEIKAEVKS
jgi:cytochrome c oxidase cbb3-type subunit I